MDITILLYDRFTALDAIGPYEVLSRIPGATVSFVASERGVVHTDVGSLGVEVTTALDEVDRTDLLLVPGGPGETRAREIGTTVEWVRAIDATTTWTTSVCTGSLVLAQAGVDLGVTYPRPIVQHAAARAGALAALAAFSGKPLPDED